MPLSKEIDPATAARIKQCFTGIVGFTQFDFHVRMIEAPPDLPDITTQFERNQGIPRRAQ